MTSLHDVLPEKAWVLGACPSVDSGAIKKHARARVKGRYCIVGLRKAQEYGGGQKPKRLARFPCAGVWLRRDPWARAHLGILTPPLHRRHHRRVRALSPSEYVSS